VILLTVSRITVFGRQDNKKCSGQWLGCTLAGCNDARFWCSLRTDGPESMVGELIIFTNCRSSGLRGLGRCKNYTPDFREEEEMSSSQRFQLDRRREGGS